MRLAHGILALSPLLRPVAGKPPLDVHAFLRSPKATASRKSGGSGGGGSGGIPGFEVPKGAKLTPLEKQ